MKKLKLNINDIIAVNYEGNFFKSNIQESSEESFSISVPLANGKYLLIEDGEELELEHYDNDFYRFNVEILGRKKSGDIPMYIVSLPYNVERIQRRRYVRVPVVKEIKYRKDDNDEWKNALTLDLSGGGLKFKSNEKLELGKKLFIKIMDIKEELDMYAEVIREEILNSQEYTYGVEFCGLRECDRDKIIQEVFLVMRKHRKNI